MSSKETPRNDTVVRVELLETKPDNPMVGKKLVVENCFEHSMSERVEATANELGFIKYGEPSSTAITAILANGNIRFGTCNIGDTNRFEICPARYAGLEVKIGSEVKSATHVVFSVLPDTNEGEIQILEYGELSLPMQ